MNFGRNFLKARANRGISQADAAQEFEVTASYLSSIENGRKKPSLDLILKAADYYQVQPGFFFQDQAEVNIDEFLTEKNIGFITDLDLEDKDKLINKYSIKFQGKELTERELKGIMAYLESLRSID